MKYVGSASCMICRRTFEKGNFEYVCPDHGNDGILDIQYDYNLIKKVFVKEELEKNRDPSIFRYLPLLPVDETALLPNLAVGGTPLITQKSI